MGHTVYDENFYSMSGVSNNPWGQNIENRCKSSKISPLGLEYNNLAAEMEIKLGKMISSYLDFKKELRLDDVLWGYWIAIQMPIGTNLPVLSSGLELLVNSWLKSSLTKNKGIYIERHDFLQLIEKEILSLSNTLDSYVFKERIINKLESAYNMGGNEKIELFFSEINLEVSKIEKEALRARNGMAHGATIKSEKEVLKAIKLSRAYETLFERSLLIVLNYDGPYRNKGVNGWPMVYIK